jgi:hypothetical protein
MMGGDPRSFGLGKEESLLYLNGEIFHYTHDPIPGDAPAVIRLVQDLPLDWKDLYAPPDPDLPRPFNPYRDLRAEVIPELQIAVARQGLFPRRDGFLEITTDARKEVIYYQRADSTRLYNCLRGQLGTQIGGYVYKRWIRRQNGQYEEIVSNNLARVLPRREVELRTRGMLGSERPKRTELSRSQVLAFPHIAVTRLAAQPTDEAFAVESAADFPTGLGYLRVDDGNRNTADEILAYSDRAGDNLFLRPRDMRTGEGILRGRFGTPMVDGLGPGAVVVEFPVRYHDRYQPQVDSAELMYYERAFRMRGALWDSIEWQEEEQRNRALNTEIRVLVRFDGAPDWDAAPTNESGGLFLLTGGDEANSLGIEADLMEMRVFYRYLPGSYGPNSAAAGAGWNDDWKHAPVLDSLRVKYRKKWRVIHREDLPF